MNVLKFNTPCLRVAGEQTSATSRAPGVCSASSQPARACRPPTSGRDRDASVCSDGTVFFTRQGATKGHQCSLNASRNTNNVRMTRPCSSATTEAQTVELKSEAGVNYEQLEQFLKEGDFRGADDETRAKLCELAGKAAVERQWVYFTEVKSIPVTDLQTIDALWKAYSNGKFGYSVQQKIWKGKRERWGQLFKALDWTTGDNNAYRSWANDEFIYSLEAAKGHLPLTSCLRGTQLITAIFEHPAFATAEKKADNGGKPSWLTW